MRTLLTLVILTLSAATLTCQANQNYARITRVTAVSAQEETHQILSGNVILYTSPRLANSQTTITEHCFDSTTNAVYRLKMMDSYGDSWATGSTIRIDGKYENTVFYGFMTDNNLETYYLSLGNPIDKNSASWKITTGTVDPTWNTAGFNDGSWDSYTAGSSVTKTGVVYLRHAFTGVNGMAAFEARMSYIAGIVAYINGAEVYRDNMPEGLISSTTPAAGAYQTLYDHILLRSAGFAQVTSSVFAIELHFQDVASTNSIQFNMFMAYYASTVLGNTCYSIPYEYGLTTSLANPDNMHDGKRTTYSNIAATELPTTITFGFTDVKVGVNGIRFWPYTNPTLAPKDFSVLGSNSASYNTLFTATNAVYTTKQFFVRYTAMDADAYKNIRLTVSSTSGTDLYLYDVSLLICNTVAPTSIVFEKESYSYYVRYESVLIKPIVPEITTCTITTGSLPTGLILDSASCSIFGSVNAASPMATYTISGVFGTTPVSGSFSLAINECTGVKLLMKRTYKDMANFETMTIKDDDTDAVLYEINQSQGQQTNKVQEFFFCTTYTRLYVQLSSASPYWAVNSYADFYVYLAENEKEYVAKTRYENALGYSTFTFTVGHVLPSQQGWYYKMGSVDANWYSSDMSSFTQGVYNAYPASTNQIQLYKKTFQVSSITDMSAVVMNIKYKYGCVVYLNGNEVFRNGVTGTLSTSSLSGNTYADVMYRSISVPLKTFVEGTIASRNNVNVGANTIAIALVAAAASNTESVFDCAVRLIGEESRVLGFTATTVNILGGNEWPFIMSSFYSMFGSMCGETSLTVTLNDDRREWISLSMIQQSVNELMDQTREFLLEGRNNNEDWVLLKNVTGLTYSMVGQKKNIWLIGNNKPFNQFRWRNFGSGIPDSCSWKVQQLDLVSGNINIVVPALVYPDVEIFRDIEMAEVYPNNEYYTKFTTNPALPAGITIDYYTGVISGTATAFVAEATYTINCFTIFESPATSTIVLAVNKCTDTRGLITFTVRGDQYLSEMSVYLYDGTTTTGTPRYSLPVFPLANGIFYLDFCLDYNIYTFQAKDTYNDGWLVPSGYMLTVDIGTLRFENSMVYTNSQPTIVTTTFSSYIPFQIEFSRWKIYQSTVASNWNTIGFDDAAWSEVEAASIPTTDSITTYIRRKFNIPNLNDYSVINARVKYSGGVAVYFNGHIVARFNLNAGFTADSEGIVVHDPTLFSKFHIILSMNEAVQGDNVIAFEIHRAPGESSASPVVFDATGVFGVQACNLLVDSYSSMGGNAVGDVINMLDGSVFTSASVTNTIGSNIRWKVENLEGSYFNSFGFYPSSNVAGLGYSLYGRTVTTYPDEEYTSMLALPSVSMTSRQRNHNDVSAALIGFMEFKYEIDVPSNTVPGIQDFVVEYCTLGGTVCSAIDDFPAVSEGQKSPARCEYGFRGYKYRECSGGTLGEIHNDLCVHKMPANIAYSKEMFNFNKDIKATTGVPTYDNIIDTFSIKEGSALPLGLTINDKTGEISGTPTTLTEAMTVIIRCENPVHVVEVNIGFSVTIATCPAEGDFDKTNVGETFVYQCSKQGGYVGTQSRKCELGPNGGVWGAPSGLCMSIITIIFIVVIVIVVILIVVFIIIRTMKKTKAKGGVKGKKTTSTAKATKKPVNKTAKV